MVLWCFKWQLFHRVGILKNSFMFNTLMFFPCSIQSTHIAISWNQLSSIHSFEILKANNWSLLFHSHSCTDSRQVCNGSILNVRLCNTVKCFQPSIWCNQTTSLMDDHKIYQIISSYLISNAYTQMLTYSEKQISCNLKMSP